MEEHTLGQKRAAHALDVINKLAEGKEYGKFGSYVQRLPATIVMNGLGQAMAGELAAARLAKGDKMSADERAHKILFDCVERWLFKSEVYTKKEGLMAAIVSSNQEDYVRAQAEALAYLGWLKKFSQAYLDGGKDDSAGIQNRD